MFLNETFTAPPAIQTTSAARWNIKLCGAAKIEVGVGKALKEHNSGFRNGTNDNTPRVRSIIKTWYQNGLPRTM